MLAALPEEQTASAEVIRMNAVNDGASSANEGRAEQDRFAVTETVAPVRSEAGAGCSVGRFAVTEIAAPVRTEVGAGCAVNAARGDASDARPTRP